MFVLFRAHLDIVLGVTKWLMLGKEGAVSPIQNVHVWVAELGILIRVERAVTVTEVLGHDRGAMYGVFAVQDQCGSRLGFCEQARGQ